MSFFFNRKAFAFQFTWGCKFEGKFGITILALCFTLVCTYGINQPSTEKEYKPMKCVIGWLFFRSFQFISVILPADML